MKLKAKQKKFLKSLVNNETPIIQIGKEGVSSSILKHIDEVLNHKELVKIRILDTMSFPLNETVEEVSKKTNSYVLRTIGKVFILYRSSDVLDEENKILLPM
jgi:RNA-binding protein